MEELEALKREYWKVVSRTRQSKRISQSVIDREEKYWSEYPDNVIAEALQIHISQYPEYKESYTRGIMNNISKQHLKLSAMEGL